MNSRNILLDTQKCPILHHTSFKLNSIAILISSSSISCLVLVVTSTFPLPLLSGKAGELVRLHALLGLFPPQTLLFLKLVEGLLPLQALLLKLVDELLAVGLIVGNSPAPVRLPVVLTRGRAAEGILEAPGIDLDGMSSKPPNRSSSELEVKERSSEAEATAGSMSRDLSSKLIIIAYSTVDVVRIIYNVFKKGNVQACASSSSPISFILSLCSFSLPITSFLYAFSASRTSLEEAMASESSIFSTMPD